MRTLDEILSNHKSNCLDGRDTYRLWKFVPWDIAKNYPDFYNTVKDEYLNEEAWNRDIYEMPFTRENIIEQLRTDVEFGFEKALDKRGISAGLMFDVVRMWNWVLNEDEELANWPSERYAMYGLPLFKATALKYGFQNPIGDDEGTESWYNDDEEEFDMYYYD